ncbi:acyltransferase [Paraburkholderia strydomiana]|uniref:acyltransferase family protein n=1 Tax=Paraburkholderia strydomiana TaxID=1245417 RepID=UPI0038B7C4F9
MSRNNHILALDGLRTFAVASVLITHYADGTSFLRHLGIDWAIVGVHIFFVLSGFLITKLLIEKYFHSDVFISGFAAFLAARVARILPLAFLAVGFIALFSPVSGQFLAYNLTFTSNFYTARTGEWFPYAGHYWSLSVEMQFYLLFPVFLWVFRKRLLAFMIVALIIALLSRYALSHISDYKNPSLLLPARVDAFLWGGLLFCASGSLSFRRISQVLFWLGAVVYFGQSVLLGLAHISTMPDMSLGNVCFTGLVGLTMCKGSLFARIFSNKTLVHFGKISYGIYIWHPIMWLARSTINDATGGILYISHVPIWTVLAVLTIFFAEISWVAVERPINTRGHQLAAHLLKMGTRRKSSSEAAAT